MIVSAKTRWFAIVTGGLLGAAGISAFGPRFALAIAGFLVAGAIVQKEFPRVGRGLMCAGALWSSFWVFWLGFLRLREFSSSAEVGPFDPIMLTCVAMMVVCDVLIAIEEVKIRRAALVANAPTRSARAMHSS